VVGLIYLGPPLLVTSYLLRQRRIGTFHRSPKRSPSTAWRDNSRLAEGLVEAVGVQG